MSAIWISTTLCLIVLAALLPDDAAIALDLLEVWTRTAWVWIRSRGVLAGLWLRLRWDETGIGWCLWLIRQRLRQNIRNNTPKENE